MTYTQFKTAMDRLKDFFKEQEKLSAVIKAISPSSTGVCEFGGHFIDAYINVIEIALEDGFEWVSWFVFDNEFGKRGLSVFIDNKEYPIYNEKDLFDIIILSKEND